MNQLLHSEDKKTVYLVLNRTSKDSFRTVGTLGIYNNGSLLALLKTLELPWLGNQRNISCIPKGFYEVKVNDHSRLGWSLEVLNVPDRSGILLHTGNFTKDTRGCIMVGLYHTDIDGDGILDVANSGAAMQTLKHYVDGSNDIKILIT